MGHFCSLRDVQDCSSPQTPAIKQSTLAELFNHWHSPRQETFYTVTINVTVLQSFRERLNPFSFPTNMFESSIYLQFIPWDHIAIACLTVTAPIFCVLVSDSLVTYIYIYICMFFNVTLFQQVSQYNRVVAFYFNPLKGAQSPKRTCELALCLISLCLLQMSEDSLMQPSRNMKNYYIRYQNQLWL